MEVGLRLNWNPNKMDDTAAYFNVSLKGDVVDVKGIHRNLNSSLSPGRKPGNYSFSSTLKVVEAINYNPNIK